MSYINLLKHQHSTKDRVVAVMGENCQLCGYNKCIKALEIHHINPQEKEVKISGNAMNRSWASLCKELEKCILVCSNCHREIHADIEKFRDLKSSYNKEIAQEFSGFINSLKTRRIHYCTKCGTIVTFKAKNCVSCGNILRRKAIRPDRDSLKEDIRFLSMLAVGKKYGVTDNAIRKWCISYNLPKTKHEINQYSDEQWVLV